jgi:hypothetical protein
MNYIVKCGKQRRAAAVLTFDSGTVWNSACIFCFWCGWLLCVVVVCVCLGLLLFVR